MVCAAALYESALGNTTVIPNITISYIGPVIVVVTAMDSIGISNTSTSYAVPVTVMTVHDILAGLHSNTDDASTGNSSDGNAHAYACGSRSQLTKALFCLYAATVLSQAQQQVASAGVQTISNLFSNSSTSPGSSGSPSKSADLSYVLNSVASVQLQLSALACASYDCGEGSCVLVAYTPTCNCDGTGFTGSNCQLPENTTSGGDSQGMQPCFNERQCVVFLHRCVTTLCRCSCEAVSFDQRAEL